jgi:N-glycosylase/DNA lyase
MNSLHIPNYNFHITLLGGQAFGWDFNPKTNEYFGITNTRAIKIKIIDSENILWQTYPIKDDFEFLSNYLNLNIDYLKILKSLPNDEYLNKAKEKYFGLRLLNQDFEEALLSYICSSNKSIKGIRYSVRLLARKYGEKIDVDGEEIYLFPKSNKIAESSLENLLETKIGFRAKYLKDTSEKLVNTNIKNEILNSDYLKAKELLKSLKGVGDKVADCVCVYSLNHSHITPLDIWGKRFLINYYNLNEKMSYEDMSKWVIQYFEGNAGIAGQMLFEYIRSEGV